MCPDAHRIAHWCSATAAHRSRLAPCTKCASELAQGLRSALGSIPSGSRKGLGLPRLLTIAGMWEREPSPTDETDADVPYGPPDSLEDPRFATRSRLDWGTHFYGQDPNEFLGGPTDDDMIGVAETRCMNRAAIEQACNCAWSRTAPEPNYATDAICARQRDRSQRLPQSWRQLGSSTMNSSLSGRSSRIQTGKRAS